MVEQAEQPLSNCHVIGRFVERDFGGRFKRDRGDSDPGCQKDDPKGLSLDPRENRSGKLLVG